MIVTTVGTISDSMTMPNSDALAGEVEERELERGHRADEQHAENGQQRIGDRDVVGAQIVRFGEDHLDLRQAGAQAKSDRGAD